MERTVEMKEIYDCQEILNFVTKARTEEELKCDKLFKNPNTIEWLSDRRSNLDKEIVKLEEEMSKSDKKREVLEKKIDGGYFIDTLNFEVNSYNIFCHKKDSKLIDKYKSNSHSEIYVTHSSCDKGTVIKELINNYDICIRENFVVIFLKSLKTSVEECRPGPEYMLDAIKDKGVRIKTNEESASLKENEEIFNSATLEKNAKILIDGPLQSEMFDSSFYEGQKKELSQELSDTKMTIHQINEYQNTEMIQEEMHNQHQEL
jgi:hypothetical protein